MFTIKILLIFKIHTTNSMSMHLKFLKIRENRYKERGIDKTLERPKNR
jgi:hypothetical protein